MKELWNKRYSENEWVYGRQPNKFFAQFIDRVKPSSLFLPAEGEGRNAIYAARRGFKVHAVDYSKIARQKALKRAKQEQVQIHYEVADLADWTSEKTFDYIGIIYMHLQPDIRVRVHDKLQNMLSDGGTIFLVTFSKNQFRYNTGGPRNRDMLYSAELLQKDFQNLSIKTLNEQVIDLTEGEFHKGNASIIQMTATKKA